MGIGSKVFEAQYGALVEARASIRVGKDVIARCLCGSFSTAIVDTDQGQTSAVVASVKMKKSDWPKAGLPDGSKIDFIRNGETDWKPFRVSGSSETDGIYSLTIEAEFA